MSFHSRNLTGTPIPEPNELEDLIRADYERARPNDTFDELKRRSRFDKQDKGLMKEWLAIAAGRHAKHQQQQKNGPEAP